MYYIYFVSISANSGAKNSEYAGAFTVGTPRDASRVTLGEIAIHLSGTGTKFVAQVKFFNGQSYRVTCNEDRTDHRILRDLSRPMYIASASERRAKWRAY